MPPSTAKSAFNTLILAVLILATFFPSLLNGFTTWDDPSYLTHNPLVASLDFDNILKIFTSFTIGSYTPLTILSFAIEYHFFQLNPIVYHLNNVLLHVGATLLVYQLILKIDGRTWAALATAMIFAVHPFKVESVAWVSERKGLLLAIFYLSALCTYIKAIHSQKSKYFWLTLFLYLCAMLCKPQALSLPFVMVALDYFYKGRLEKKDFIKKLPFFFFVAAFFLLGLKQAFEIIPTEAYFGIYQITEKFILTNYAIYLYLILSLFPLKTAFFYPFPSKVHGVFHLIVYLSMIFNVMTAYSIWKFSQRNRYVNLAALLFIIMLFMPLTNIWFKGYFISERFMYLPSIWLIYGFIRLAEEIRTKIPWPSSYAKMFVIITVSFFATLSFGKCFVWNNDLSLWSNTIETFPNSPTGYAIRGDKLRELGWRELALKDLNKALELSPDFFEAYFSRGTLYMDAKEYVLAKKDFDKAVILRPHDQRVQMYLAFCERKLKKINRD